MTDQEPALQSPGAGLPWYELALARAMVGWKARRATRAASAALFARERGIILEKLRACPSSQRATRVLIPCPRGLEDSSRHWSMYMTLDHPRIVNHGTGELIRLLGRDWDP